MFKPQKLTRACRVPGCQHQAGPSRICVCCTFGMTRGQFRRLAVVASKINPMEHYDRLLDEIAVEIGRSIQRKEIN